MTFTPLLICTICYVLTAIGFFREGQVGMVIAFTGYTIGNIGFLYISLSGSRSGRRGDRPPHTIRAIVQASLALQPPK